MRRIKVSTVGRGLANSDPIYHTIYRFHFEKILAALHAHAISSRHTIASIPGRGITNGAVSISPFLLLHSNPLYQWHISIQFHIPRTHPHTVQDFCELLDYSDQA